MGTIHMIRNTSKAKKSWEGLSVPTNSLITNFYKSKKKCTGKRIEGKLLLVSNTNKFGISIHSEASADTAI